MVVWISGSLAMKPWRTWSTDNDFRAGIEELIRMRESGVDPMRLLKNIDFPLIADPVAYEAYTTIMSHLQLRRETDLEDSGANAAFLLRMFAVAGNPRERYTLRFEAGESRRFQREKRDYEARLRAKYHNLVRAKENTR